MRNANIPTYKLDNSANWFEYFVEVDSIGIKLNVKWSRQTAPNVIDSNNTNGTDTTHIKEMNAKHVRLEIADG